MEERKLTKADIDKVRHIEGFPITAKKSPLTPHIRSSIISVQRKLSGSAKQEKRLTTLKTGQ